MMDRLEKLHDLCCEYSVLLSLDMWDNETCFSISITSSAKGEEYYEKKVYDIDDFIENYRKHLKELL